MAGFQIVNRKLDNLYVDQLTRLGNLSTVLLKWRPVVVYLCKTVREREETPSIQQVIIINNSPRAMRTSGTTIWTSLCKLSVRTLIRRANRQTIKVFAKFFLTEELKWRLVWTHDLSVLPFIYTNNQMHPKFVAAKKRQLCNYQC